jgi:hypothetical protein
VVTRADILIATQPYDRITVEARSYYLDLRELIGFSSWGGVIMKRSLALTKRDAQL